MNNSDYVVYRVRRGIMPASRWRKVFAVRYWNSLPRRVLAGLLGVRVMDGRRQPIREIDYSGFRFSLTQVHMKLRTIVLPEYLRILLRRNLRDIGASLGEISESVRRIEMIPVTELILISANTLAGSLEDINSWSDPEDLTHSFPFPVDRIYDLTEELMEIALYLIRNSTDIYQIDTRSRYEVSASLRQMEIAFYLFADDFAGSDLRGIERIQGIDPQGLGGLTWDDDTQWPAGWEEIVRENSTEVSGRPGVYVVRDHRVSSGQRI